MKNLLLDEYPIMVLPTLATAIGLNEAIILQQVHYWLQKSKHEHDGKKWIYNSYPEWQKQFPFWTERTIWTAIARLEGKQIGKAKQLPQLLITGNYNKLKIDKTKWYTIDYDAITKFSVSISQNLRDHQEVFARPLPETTTETTQVLVTNGIFKNKNSHAKINNSLMEVNRQEKNRDSQFLHGYEPLNKKSKELEILAREFPLLTNGNATHSSLQSPPHTPYTTTQGDQALSASGTPATDSSLPLRHQGLSPNGIMPSGPLGTPSFSPTAILITKVSDYLRQQVPLITGWEHPVLSDKAVGKALENMIAFQREHNLSLEEWQAMVDRYLSTDFKHPGFRRHTLWHFASPKILENRYNEVVYRDN